MKDSGGVLTPAKPLGHAKKSAGYLAIKGYRPEEGSLYDLIKGRMAAAHESGKAHASRTLHRRATEDEGGPMAPRARAKGFSDFFARLGFEYTKRRKLIVDSMRDPYDARWRNAC